VDIERAEIPESMDMSDEGYRERLSEIFRQHRNHDTRNFDYFYQSQVLWDETMADSIYKFLRKNPDSQMVVLAGNGHIMYDSGIPKRTHRLNGKDYVTVIPGTESFHEDSGDYLFSAERLPAPPTFKLGVVLKEKGGRVEIEQIVPGSIAKSAGLEKGDILLSFDDWKIEDIADVNIFMFDKKRGEKFTVKVLRKRFLTGYKEVILNGTI
jgi:membrane-associated protease RseP (regulator of RpoE activity)